MKFFISTLIASVAFFFMSSILFEKDILFETERAFSCGVIISIFAFVYSVVAILIVSIKKKDSPNINDVKEFQQKVIFTFLVLLAFLILLCFAFLAMNSGNTFLTFFILALLLVSLISVPVIIQSTYRRQEHKDETRILEELLNYNQENKF